MANIFLISDTHFGHAGMCQFLLEDGSKARPWDHPDEMDAYMIENWNKKVKPHDKVYHLGDVAIKKSCIPTMKKLNGEKVLIKGNHDIFKIHDYLPFFKDIRASHKLDKFILSHIPIHPISFKGWPQCNFHGHLHTKKIMLDDNNIHPQYLNVCVECIDYTPISFEDAKIKFKKQMGE
jgi:calcineurin-like phosphoesterase family protein